MALIRKSQPISLINQDQQGTSLPLMRNQGIARLRPRPRRAMRGARATRARHGGVAERSKAHAWKVCIRETVSRVRIPPSPPTTIVFVGVFVSNWLTPINQPTAFHRGLDSWARCYGCKTRVARSHAWMSCSWAPVLKKLLKLKEWLTVPNAARHLTILFGGCFGGGRSAACPRRAPNTLSPLCELRLRHNIGKFAGTERRPRNVWPECLLPSGPHIA